MDGRPGEMMEGERLVDVLYVYEDLEDADVVLQGDPSAVLLRDNFEEFVSAKERLEDS